MKPLDVLYWSRAGLGIAAALVCTALRIQSLLSGLSLGILVYILTNYLLRRVLIAKVEKPSKLFTTGIGAYFLTWLVTWVLLYTILVGG